jgi:hypothetical protein
MRKIKELEEVELKKDLPELGLKKGQVGIVALIHNKREIEFCCSGEKAMMIKLNTNLIQ